MKNITKQRTEKRVRRHAAIRSKISGTGTVPRLSVFRSNKFIYVQLIDDVSGRTLASASDIKNATGTKTERATQIGRTISSTAQKLGITKIVFDRGGFKYIGRVRAVAEGAREAGLQF